MKRILIALIFAVALTAGGSVWASCPLTPQPPLRFACGFTMTATKAIQGTPTDANPVVSVGTLSFDTMDNPTLTVVINANGTMTGSASAPVTFAGTCAQSPASSNGAIGRLDFSGAGGPVIDFVQSIVGGESALHLMTVPASPSGALIQLGTCVE